MGYYTKGSTSNIWPKKIKTSNKNVKRSKHKGTQGECKHVNQDRFSTQPQAIHLDGCMSLALYSHQVDRSVAR